MKTLLQKLGEASMTCSNVEYRKMLKDANDKIYVALNATYRNPTDDNMRDLNGAWAHGVRVLENIPPEAPPAPVSGPTEAPVLQRMAA